MHQYIVGQGYWSYVDGANKSQPSPTHADHLAWEQATSRVLYCLTSFVHDYKEIGVGEPQKDICGKHNRMKASTPPRVEQH